MHQKYSHQLCERQRTPSSGLFFISPPSDCRRRLLFIPPAERSRRHQRAEEPEAAVHHLLPLRSEAAGALRAPNSIYSDDFM